MSGFLHLLPDCATGNIPLLAPWSMRLYALATVPAQQHPWWLNFLQHWSFLLELHLIAASACLMVSGRKKSSSPWKTLFSPGKQHE